MFFAYFRFVDEVLLSSENRVSDSDDKTFFIGVYDDRNGKFIGSSLN